MVKDINIGQSAAKHLVKDEGSTTIPKGSTFKIFIFYLEKVATYYLYMLRYSLFPLEIKGSKDGKFTDLGVSMNKVMVAARDCRKELKCYFLWHPEVTAQGNLKMKTVGKMIDDYLTLEGLFTVIIYSRVVRNNEKIEYEFVTNNDGALPAKSPYGMFPSLYVKNDLGYISEKIDEYNAGDVEEPAKKKASDILEV